MKRTHILATLAATALLGLAACSTTPTVSSVEADATTLVTGLQAAAPLLAALDPTLIPANDLTTFQADLAKAQGYLADFSNVGTSTTTAGEVTTAVSDALKAVSSLNLPTQAATLVNAANVLLPVVLAEAGLPAPAGVVLKPSGVVYTPAQARAILQNAAISR